MRSDRKRVNFLSALVGPFAVQTPLGILRPVESDGDGTNVTDVNGRNAGSFIASLPLDPGFQERSSQLHQRN